MAGRFTDGAWLAELAAVRDPAQVAAVVAAALGIPEQPGTPLAEALARVLAGQQLLLVLDNCEHVIGAAAELCAGLLAACDDVRVLATSREPLAVAGEARYRLGPLTLPAPGDPADGGRSEAVALFADRARRADPRFVLDGQAGPAVARLVARLDGMPLAIELAAARVEALGVAQLAGPDRGPVRAADRRGPAGGGSAAVAGGHGGVELPAARSSTSGGCSARCRCSRRGSRWRGPRRWPGRGAGPVVLRLVDCSLLIPPRAGPDGRSRYVMLETLRAYGAGLLAEAGEQEERPRRWPGTRCGWPGRLRPGCRPLTGSWPRPAGWTPRTPPCGRRWPGRWSTTRPWRCGWPTRWPGGGLLRGRLAGEYRLLRQAAGRAEAGSDGWCAAQLWLGWTAQFSADLAASLGHFTAVRDAARPAAVPGADRRPGRPGFDLAADGPGCRGGRRCPPRAGAGPGDRGPGRGAAGPGRTSVSSADYAGDHDEAVRLARQAGQITAGIPGGLARLCSSVLTIVLAGAGDLAEAERVGAAGLARARDAGDLWNQAVLLPRIVDLDLRAGRTGDAAAHLREGLHLAVRTGTWFELRFGLSQCGELCAATGRAAEALTLWAACAAVDQHQGPTYPPWFVPRREEQQRQARQALGPGRAREAEERGAAMSLATAAEYALMLTDPGPPQPAAPGPGTLSARERELVSLVAQGRTNAQIAAELHISVRTVGSHLDRIRDKTGCRRRADLTRLALSARLV